MPVYVAAVAVVGAGGEHEALARQPPAGQEGTEGRVFAAALPGSYLQGLTYADVAALGRGRYREGDLTSSVPRFARLLEG